MNREPSTFSSDSESPRNPLKYARLYVIPRGLNSSAFSGSTNAILLRGIFDQSLVLPVAYCMNTESECDVLRDAVAEPRGSLGPHI